MSNKIVAVVGPTASGKTALAIELCQGLPGEVVGCDSMQVYKGMDIGTAKPTEQEQATVPHHLIDMVYPDSPYHASLYANHATDMVARLSRRGKVPVVTGGTGLYLRALTHGLCQAPPQDPELRSRLEVQARDKGVEALHERLCRVDPATAARVAPRDRTRVLRALEVHALTGVTMSDHIKAHQCAPLRHHALVLGVHLEREVLYARIESRVDAMMEAGFMDEVEGLIRQGFSPSLKPMQALGYRQLAGVLAGEASLEEAIVNIKQETRNYAKRQQTWFRKVEGIRWITPSEAGKALKWAEEHML